MKLKGIFFFLTFSITCFAQNDSYSLLNGEVLILKTEVSDSSFLNKVILRKDISAKDSALTLNKSFLTKTEFESKKQSCGIDLFFQPISPFRPNFQPQSYSTEDSILVSGKRYRINFTFFDDGFIGGMSNQVQIKICVESVGVIYSNFIAYPIQNNSFMICNKNPVKQKILLKAYEYCISNFSIENKYHLNIEQFKAARAITQRSNFGDSPDNILRRTTKYNSLLKLHY